MKPLSKKDSPCTEIGYSDCVKWTGPDIACLGICTGESVTETVAAIAEKVCELVDATNLEDLDLHCLIDLCGECPEQKSLKNILQLLLDNQCKLKQLIDAAGGSSSEETTLNLNLKCLRKFDEFENEIPQDLNQTLQSLINEVCLHKTKLSQIEGRVNDLQQQIDNIDVTPEAPEPVITTCLTSPKPVSQAVVAIAGDICDFKSKVGTGPQIQTAISKQCRDLVSEIGSMEGFILQPQNLAQSFNNLWLAYCNLLDRVKNIENNCCKVTCKDIVIALDVKPNSDGDAITVKFSEFLGTFIPDGFEDCGSVLTITDIDGNHVEYPIEVSSNGTQGEFSFAGLNTSGVMTASVNAKLCSETLSCEKCVAKQFIPTSGCPVCAITASGRTGSVTIVYQA